VSAVKKVRGLSAVPIAKMNVNAPTADFLAKLDEGIKKVSIESVKTAEPFASLLPIREEVLAAITENMRIRGYDMSQPLIIWKERGVLVDGHTRLTAAKAVGLPTVPVIYASFTDTDTVIGYMLQIQFSRRNIRDGELVALAKKTLDNYQKVYGEGGKAEFLVKKFIGLSYTKAKKVYYIVETATERDMEMLRNEEITINKLYDRLKDAELLTIPKKVHVGESKPEQLPDKPKAAPQPEKKVHVGKSKKEASDDDVRRVYLDPKSLSIYKQGEGEPIKVLTFADRRIARKLSVNIIREIDQAYFKN
jgi:ParB family chromosome partitioning protein